MKCEFCNCEFSETVYPIHLRGCKPTEPETIEELNSTVSAPDQVEGEEGKKEETETEQIIEQAPETVGLAPDQVEGKKRSRK